MFMKSTESSELKPQLDRLTFLHELGKLLAVTGDSQDVLRTMMEKANDFFRPRRLSLLVLDEESQTLCPEIVLGPQAEEPRPRLPLGEGVAGWVAERGEPLLVEDIRNDPRFRASPVAQETGIGSVLGVPVRGREAVLGVIELADGLTEDGLSEEEVLTLVVVADYVAAALEGTRHTKRMLELTLRDDCTGLYNARHLDQMLEAEIHRSSRFGHEFSIIFMDLDHFKGVNDAYGHVVGSKVLGTIGELVKSQLRLIDSPFRYGGDEFVLLLPQTSRENALVLVRRLQEALNAWVFVTGDGRNIRMTASYGVASFPADSSTAQALLRAADQAMYRIKSTSRDGIALAGGESGAP